MPWLGYFHRIAVSDVHVVLDHVQFEKNSFVNRNRIRTAQGTTWLTVPVKTAGRFGDLPINTAEIAGDNAWERKHAATLRQEYARAPHFAEYAPFIDELYARQWKEVGALCEASTGYLCDALGIDTPRVSSGSLGINGVKDELVLALCKHFGATTYLSGALGRNYLREELFEAAGIEVRYQDYVHPEYAQLHEPFIPNLSVVDLLMNRGRESLDVILSTGG